MEKNQAAEDHNAEEQKKYQACLNDTARYDQVPADNFSWVGVDTAGLQMIFGFGFKIDLGWFGMLTIIPPFKKTIDIPLSYAAARAGKFDNANPFPIDAMDMGSYGNANKPGQINVGYTLAKYLWGRDGLVTTPYPVYPVDFAKKQIWNPIRSGKPPSAKGPVYEGLQKYLHIKDLGYTDPVSPSLLVEIYKPADKAIRQGNTSVAGRFDVSADQPVSIYAAAKAELLFDRTLFPRVDGGVEYGNMFNPYWQARLTKLETSNKLLAVDESQLLWYYRAYINKK